MAEGGGEFGMDNPDLDHDIDIQMTTMMILMMRSTQPGRFSPVQHPPPTMAVNNMKCKLCITNRAVFQKHHMMKVYLCWAALRSR